MTNPDGLTCTLTAYAALSHHAHIDDAVDRLFERIGWDSALMTLASMDEARAAMGLYSMVCGLFIADAG